MLASAIPTKIQLPFAASGDKVTIPVPSQIGVVDGRASFTTGFVPLNATPLSAGGVAPFETDFNGIFNQITAIQQWQSAGGIFTYDPTFSAAIGGYPKGAILADTAGTGTWLSIVDNNVTNPDAGGSGWLRNSAGRLRNVITVSATETYTPGVGVSYVIVEAQGGGGAGGGTPVTSASQIAVSGGGASGAYAKSLIPAASLGASVSITIGNGGAGSVGGAGAAGLQTTFGGLITCPGGGGAAASVAVALSSPVASPGGTPANAATGGNIVSTSGICGAPGFNIGISLFSGYGGGSPINNGGSGANAVGTGTSGIQAAAGSGAGGGGACGGSSNAARAGGAGGSGRVIIYEYS